MSDLKVTPPGEMSPPDPERRRALEWLVQGFGAVIGILVALPLIGPIIAPAMRRRRRRYYSLGSVEQFQTDEPVSTAFELVRYDGWREVRESRKVYVRRLAPGQFIAYSIVCTHLGCSVRWDGETDRFRCPCHGGVYDIEGEVVAGPPPRPLTRLRTFVSNNELIVEEV